MKIGILTYHRSHNYGALLQAIALRFKLTSYGHNVAFVDYWPDYHKEMYRPISFKRLKMGRIPGRIKYLADTFLRLPKIIARINCFNKFIDTYISPYCCPITQKLDMVVYGSDQIWRKQDGLNGHFNPVYFGQNQINATTHLSYAASMGVINLSHEDKVTLKEWLAKFKAISVREDDLLSMLNEIGVNNAMKVLDPTLLLSSHEWRKILDLNDKSFQKYVLFYDLMPDSFDEKRIKKFAKEKNLRLIILKARIDKMFHNTNELIAESPRDMVNLIANAEYVFTSSYHGLVFSLIFEKQVIAAFHHNKGRAETLLSSLGISNRLLNSRNETFPKEAIDYINVRAHMVQLKNQSNSFIQSYFS